MYEATNSPPVKPGAGAADDLLPRVTAPNAGFLLQLFLIPLIIVSIIVMVWLMFSWLAHMGGDPRDLVRKLQKGDDASWQAANTLAEMLRDPQQEHLKFDDKLAGELGDVLKKHLASDSSRTGSPDENQVNLGIFLCRALGEFSTASALAPLVAAADSETAHPQVRREALRALALLANNLGPEKVRQDKPTMQALVAAASLRGGEGDDLHDRAELRSSAAFALGVIGGDEALDKLARLLDDADPNVRYNAATGMARHGDVRSIPVLLEMLDPNNEAAIAGEKSESTREWKQGLVNINGAKASQALAEKLAKRTATTDLQPLAAALDQLANSDGPLPVRNAAREARVSIAGK